MTRLEIAVRLLAASVSTHGNVAIDPSYREAAFDSADLILEEESKRCDAERQKHHAEVAARRKAETARAEKEEREMGLEVGS